MIALDDILSATSADVLVRGERATFDGFAHDSRTVQPGACFVAVRGMHTDGHEFLEDAIERGAGALLAERSRIASLSAGAVERLRRSGATVMLVGDTREALRRYAAYILRQWQPTVVAVTGSTGKTTTKEAIADVLDTLAPTFRSWQNYNDLLGLPLSLGRLEPVHRYAVVELAADHPGEIRDLCAIVRPTIGVVTNVSPTHLQYFDSLDAYAHELAELVAALPPDGAALLNANDQFAGAMAERSKADVVRFGPLTDETPSPDALPLRYTIVPLGTRESLALTLRRVGPENAREAPAVFPHLHGDHWADAVLAAVTVGQHVGVSPERAIEVLRDLRPLPGRMSWLDGTHGMTLLDDSHNATPSSATAGITALDAIAQARHQRRIAVLGDMLRLGAYEAESHAALGRYVAPRVDYLITNGLRAEVISDEALRAGLPSERVAITHTPDDAARAVLTFAAEDVAKPPVVYIKGSEEMRLEQVTAQLLAHPEQAETVLPRQTQAWRRVVVMRPDRPTWLEIDLSAIGENTQRIAEIVGPDVAVLVSLKADAYGHGALRVARTVLRNGASWLGVATVSEAQPLRSAGITKPVLVFGYTPPWQARDAVSLDVRTTVYSLDSARALSRAATDLGRLVRVHVKVDTGMARLGLRAENPEEIVAFCQELRALPNLEVEGIFTHFATADSADQTYARMQLARFERVLEAFDRDGGRPPIVHASNSAATLTLPEARFNMVRPGIAIYGLAPSREVPLPAGFSPALSFKTQVAQVKDIPAGEGISYGATFVTPAPMRIAVLPVGYADGFRRAPANWGEVLVRGARAPLLGRVAMDQCMIDVTDIPAVRQGDEVVLIGTQGSETLSADDVAARLGTINYEVVSALLARVPRIS